MTRIRNFETCQNLTFPDSAVLEGSGGLLMSKEDAERSVANASPSKTMNSQGEIRCLLAQRHCDLDPVC
jgi:hypothetical protein